MGLAAILNRVARSRQAQVEMVVEALLSYLPYLGG